MRLNKAHRSARNRTTLSAHAKNSRRDNARSVASRPVLSRALLAASVGTAVLALSAPAVATVSNRPAAARSLTPVHGLRAELLETGVSPLTPTIRTRKIRLRTPNPSVYAAAKSRAERAYLARSHSRVRTHDALAPRVGTAIPLTSAPGASAALFQELNAPGTEGGGPFTQGTPPDTTGAVGPNNYVEFVNSQVAVYNRALSLQTTTSEDAFTGGSGTCDGQIRWDQQGERWEYASLACAAPTTEQSYMFGWSKTADPTNLSTGWCRYGVHTKELLFDYPKLGGDNEYLMIGENEFNMTTEAYVNSGIVVIPKPAAGESTCPSSLTLTRFVGAPFTPVPANLYGSSTTGYAVAAEFPEPTGSELGLLRLTQSAGKPKIEGRAIAVASYSIPAAIPQPGTTDGLDSSDTRLTQAVAAEDPTRHEIAIWTQHTVAPAVGEPSIVRWYELTPGSPSPVQEGSVTAAAGNFAFNGAISPTRNGNGAAIDYNVGGSAKEVELRAQSRGPTTPTGTMSGELKLAGSTGIDKDFSCPSVEISASSCRWGDYAGASPDPVSPGVVWGTGEVNGAIASENNPQWQTENFALALHAPPTAEFSIASEPPTARTPVNFDASASSDSAEALTTYEWSFGDGTNGGGEKPSHTYEGPGKYPVRLTVADAAGFRSSVEHEVTIADAPPVAAFTVSTPAPTVGSPVGFDGSASRDPDGAIVSYSWSFGDGSPPQEGVAPAHTYTAEGEYTVRLTVTDEGLLTNKVTHAVTVAVAPPPPPPPAKTSGTTDVEAGKEGTPARSSNGPPPNVVHVTGVKQNQKKGTAALSVTVPGPGVLSAREASAAHSSLVAPLAGALAAPAAYPVALVVAARDKANAKGPFVKSASITVGAAGTVTIQIVPNATGGALLKRKHKLALKILIAFTPTGGAQRTLVQPVTLVRRPARKHK